MISSMQAQSTNLSRLQELENSGRTGKLANSELSALRTVADWIETFVQVPALSPDTIAIKVRKERLQ